MKGDRKGKGLRYNKGKNRLELIPSQPILDIGSVFTKGAAKYTVYKCVECEKEYKWGESDGQICSDLECKGKLTIYVDGADNWRDGMSWRGIMASVKRHIAAWEKGVDVDFDPNCEGCQNGNCHNHLGKDIKILAQSAWGLIAILEYYNIYPQGDDRYIKPQFKIGLDIDEVICDWLTAWRKRWDIKDVPHSWYFDIKISERFEEMKKSGELEEFYMNLEPKIKADDLPFEPHCYITSRPCSRETTIKWLEKHNFSIKCGVEGLDRAVYQVDANHSKVDWAKSADIDFMVDDNYFNFIDLTHNGVKCYLYDAPHNQRYDVGHWRIKDFSQFKPF